MVIDTIDQGQTCLDYLRKQGVGRASFLVLEKLTGQPSQERTPLPRLFDLVKLRDPRFAPAFWKALGNTLVARDIDEANAVATGGGRGPRYRVVTLDGQVVDSSGTMSGGGSTVSRGGMSNQFAAPVTPPGEMRRLEQEAERATAALAQAQEELRVVEAQIEGLRRAGPQIDMDLKKLELDASNSASRIADTEKRVRDLKYAHAFSLRVEAQLSSDPVQDAEQAECGRPTPDCGPRARDRDGGNGSRGSATPRGRD
jgi:structural maintenance of chromosome 4